MNSSKKNEKIDVFQISFRLSRIETENCKQKIYKIVVNRSQLDVIT